MSDDIITLIARFQTGLVALGLKRAEAIILKSQKDGMHIMCELAQRNLIFTPGDGMHGKPVEHPDGSVWMEIEIYGTKVRWPAVKFALQSGGFVWQ